MTEPHVDIALDAGAQLGECPLWSPEEQRLYWIDIAARQIHRFDPATGSDEVRTIPTRPGSIVRTDETGRLLVATEADVAWFDFDAGELTQWRRVEPADTGNRLNDGRTDSAGRYWVGSMYEDTLAGLFTGHLHRIEASGHVTTIRHEVGVSNGMAFDPDRGRMYFADTMSDTVWRYRYDVETGAATEPVPFIDFSGYEGHPDGACVDAEGGYWVAAVWAWSVMRFTPDGELDRTIRLPVEAPTMPAFGGADLDTLFVTSISTGGSRTPSPDQQHAGAVVAIDAGVAGRIDAPFAGAPS